MPSKSFNVDHSPGDLVYHVTENGILEGSVVTIQIHDNAAETITTYHVRYVGQANTVPVTSGLYADLGSAQAGSTGGGALEAYQTLLLS